MLPEVVPRRESRRFGPTLLLVMVGLGAILERILMRRRTLALGLIRTRCRTEWATDGSLLMMFPFVSALFDVLFFYVRKILSLISCIPMLCNCSCTCLLLMNLCVSLTFFSLVTSVCSSDVSKSS